MNKFVLLLTVLFSVVSPIFAQDVLTGQVIVQVVETCAITLNTSISGLESDKPYVLLVYALVPELNSEAEFGQDCDTIGGPLYQAVFLSANEGRISFSWLVPRHLNRILVSVIEVDGFSEVLTFEEVVDVSEAEESVCSTEMIGWSRLLGLAQARVSDADPSTLPMRIAPSLSAERVGEIAPNEAIPLLGGPYCKDGWVWWLTQHQDVFGYVGEVDKRLLYNILP